MAEQDKKRLRERNPADEIDPQTGEPYGDVEGVQEDDWLPFGLDNLFSPGQALKNKLGKVALKAISQSVPRPRPSVEEEEVAPRIEAKGKKPIPVAESIQYTPKEMRIAYLRQAGETTDPIKQKELIEAARAITVTPRK